MAIACEKKFTQTLRVIEDCKTSLSIETFLLKKTIYKRYSQFRMQKLMRGMKQVLKCLKKAEENNVVSTLKKFKESIRFNGDGKIREEIDREFLTFLITITALFFQTTNYCLLTVFDVRQQLEIERIVPRNLFFTALLSRIWSITTTLSHQFRKLCTSIRKNWNGVDEILFTELCEKISVPDSFLPWLLLKVPEPDVERQEIEDYLYRYSEKSVQLDEAEELSEDVINTNETTLLSSYFQGLDEDLGESVAIKRIKLGDSPREDDQHTLRIKEENIHLENVQKIKEKVKKNKTKRKLNSMAGYEETEDDDNVNKQNKRIRMSDDPTQKGMKVTDTLHTVGKDQKRKMKKKKKEETNKFVQCSELPEVKFRMAVKKVKSKKKQGIKSKQNDDFTVKNKSVKDVGMEISHSKRNDKKDETPLMSKEADIILTKIKFEKKKKLKDKLNPSVSKLEGANNKLHVEKSTLPVVKNKKMFMAEQKSEFNNKYFQTKGDCDIDKETNNLQFTVKNENISKENANETNVNLRKIKSKKKKKLKLKSKQIMPNIDNTYALKKKEVTPFRDSKKKTHQKKLKLKSGAISSETNDNFVSSTLFPIKKKKNKVKKKTKLSANLNSSIDLSYIKDENNNENESQTLQTEKSNRSYQEKLKVKKKKRSGSPMKGGENQKKTKAKKEKLFQTNSNAGSPPIHTGSGSVFVTLNDSAQIVQSGVKNKPKKRQKKVRKQKDSQLNKKLKRKKRRSRQNTLSPEKLNANLKKLKGKKTKKLH